MSSGDGSTGRPSVSWNLVGMRPTPLQAGQRTFTADYVQVRSSSLSCSPFSLDILAEAALARVCQPRPSAQRRANTIGIDADRVPVPRRRGQTHVWEWNDILSMPCRVRKAGAVTGCLRNRRSRGTPARQRAVCQALRYHYAQRSSMYQVKLRDGQNHQTEARLHCVGCSYLDGITKLHLLSPCMQTMGSSR